MKKELEENLLITSIQTPKPITLSMKISPVALNFFHKYPCYLKIPFQKKGKK